jgi:hypothetical protein
MFISKETQNSKESIRLCHVGRRASVGQKKIPLLNCIQLLDYYKGKGHKITLKISHPVIGTNTIFCEFIEVFLRVF